MYVIWGKGPKSSFWMWLSIQVSQNHFLKRLFFSSRNGIATFSKNQLTINVQSYFQTLISFLSMSMLMPAPHCLVYHCFVVYFDIVKCKSFYFALFEVCFGSFGSLEILEIPYGLKNQLVCFCRELNCNSNGMDTVLNL